MTARGIRIGAVVVACAAAVAAGAAFAQTTPAPRDQQSAPATRGTESKDTKTAVADSWITAKTKIALFADDRVSGMDVNVTTINGIVKLNGKVDSTQAKAAAEEVARGIDGVRQVQNNLQVVAAERRDRVDARDEEITKRVQERIAQDSRLRNDNVNVTTNAGVVRLTGDVETMSMSVAASEVARRVPGVRSVRNEIAVKREDRMGRDLSGDRMTTDPSGMRDGAAERWNNAASGERVRRVQEALKDKGHDPGAVDGVLGPNTQQAIREFQKAENLPATGRLDGQTVSRLGVEGAGATGRQQAR
jgi:hyperosmotically inducible protein